MATFTAGQILTAGDLTSALSPAVQTESETDVSITNSSSTAYADLGGNDMDFTMSYPASGKVLFAVMVSAQPTLADVGEGFMSLEIRDTNASGTQRLAPNDRNGTRTDVENREPYVTGVFLATGLPTSGTMFVRAKYRIDANGSSNTVTWFFRRIIAIPQP